MNKPYNYVRDGLIEIDMDKGMDIKQINHYPRIRKGRAHPVHERELAVGVNRRENPVYIVTQTASARRGVQSGKETIFVDLRQGVR